MIETINIQNLALITKCHISWHEGFNVITGETGAGKSALIQAIRLCLGARADGKMIRKDEEKAQIDLSFSLDKNSPIYPLLEKSGITLSYDEPLIITRILQSSGKSKSFINSQIVGLFLIQEIASYLVEIIDQSSSNHLKELSFQREQLDLFALDQKELLEMKENYHNLKKYEKTLFDLKEEEERKKREKELNLFQLNEIEEGKWSEEEETLLEQEHNRLSSSENFLTLSKETKEGLQSALSILTNLKKAITEISLSDNALSDLTSSYKSSYIEIQEMLFQIESKSSLFEADPKRLSYIEEKLAIWHQLKKKYGSLNEKRENIQNSLASLDSLDLQIKELENSIKDLTTKTEKLSKELSEKRKKSAKKLSSFLMNDLQKLCMPSCEISINLKNIPLKEWGEDQIEFHLKANSGEPFMPLNHFASGGELSRLLFSLKCQLAKKNQTPTLIFDEIDANVGGKSSFLMGEKLKTLSETRQVICITHFPQVATQCDHHLQIEKTEKNKRTHTTIRLLNKKEQEEELVRMIGGNKSAILFSEEQRIDA